MNIKGFTFLELIIVLAIIAILASISYPSYKDYITRARRGDGQTALLDLSARLEKYYSQHQTYETATIHASPLTDVLSDAHSPQNWYTLSIIMQDASSYTIRAMPIKTQALNDRLCQALTINSLGIKGITAGPSGFPQGLITDCW